MPGRRLSGTVLRVLGLVAAAAVAVAAIQALLVALDLPPLLDRERADDLVTQASRDIRPGAAMLVGVGLAVLGVLLVAMLVIDLRRRRRGVLSFSRDDGRTRIDRIGLASVLERDLNALDPRVDVDVDVTSRADLRVRIHTPDSGRTGPASQISNRIGTLVAQRHYPIRRTKLFITTAKGRARRMRVA